MKVAVVDYGLANVRSVLNAIDCFSIDAYLASSGEDLMAADKIILPGVGSFDAGMQGLHARGHVAALSEAVLARKIPCLGICLGFQFLFESSEEGSEPGLGWLPGHIRCFDKSQIKVPHMGWNTLRIRENKQIFRELADNVDVYFVHSYYAPHSTLIEPFVAGDCHYGVPYVAAVEKEHIVGVQFHPEKSQLVGMKILENFLLHHAH